MSGPVVSSLFASDRKALLILFFLSFIYFLENFDRALISVSPIPYVDYGSYEYSILAGPAFTIVYTLGGVFFALLSYHDPASAGKHATPQKWNKFAILSLTTFIFSGAFLATAYALYFWQQVLVRLVMGLSQSIITPFSTSIISDYFPPAMRGAAFGLFNSGTYLSFALTLSLGIYVYTEYGWQAGYLVFGLIGVAFSLVMPALSLLKANTTPDESTNSTDSSRLAQNHHGVAPSVDIDTKSVIFNHLHSTKGNTTSSDGTGMQEHKSEEWQEFNAPQTWTDKFRTMFHVAYEIVGVRWRGQPGIYLLCLATGIRIGAGYVWSAYTGVFFSDLFETEDGSCTYSFNDQFAGALPSTVCDSDYPYCVSGTCSALNAYPWHNKGMASIHLITFMGWVPIVGSAFGNVLGGFVSDYFIGRQGTRSERHLRQSADVAVSPLVEVPLGADQSTSASKGNASVDHHEEFMVSSESAANSTPLLSIISATEEPAQTAQTAQIDQSLRMWIAGWSNLLPVPLIVGALLLEFPYCFVIMIFSGMIGEMYMGQALATITDATLTPAHHVTPAVALFMFVITMIGGNMPLLVPLVNSWVGFDGQANVSFDAAPVYTADGQDASDVEFTVLNGDARQMQYGLLVLLVSCYAVSGVLYLISYQQMRSAAKTRETDQAAV